MLKAANAILTGRTLKKGFFALEKLFRPNSAKRNRFSGLGKTFTVAAALLVCSAAVHAEVADRIVAVVNNEVITLSEMNKAFEPYRERFAAGYRGEDQKKALDEAKASFLDRMVDNVLVEQEAKKTGIAVSDEEVEEALREIRAQHNLSEEDFFNLIAKEGMTPAEFKRSSREQLVRIKLIGRDIRSKVVVTEQEIGDYYAKHREEYEGKESVRIRQILLLLPTGADSETKEKLRAEAEAIHKQLLAGKPFEELCAKFSQGQGAEEGGDIGFIEKGTILPEVESAAFSLPTGRFSPVIESPVGFHIIQVTDRRGAGIKAIKNVRAEIKRKIENEKLEKKLEEWLKELRKKSNVEIRL
jgi:parvulin-like peptidyl-prolyl isomerase